MVTVTFEHAHDAHPEITLGPFEWIEMISGNMFGKREGEDEAEEIAGFNDDNSWDACPDGEVMPRERRKYTRFIVSPVTE